MAFQPDSRPAHDEFITLAAIGLASSLLERETQHQLRGHDVYPMLGPGPIGLHYMHGHKQREGAIPLLQEELIASSEPWRGHFITIKLDPRINPQATHTGFIAKVTGGATTEREPAFIDYCLRRSLLAGSLKRAVTQAAKHGWPIGGDFFNSMVSLWAQTTALRVSPVAGVFGQAQVYYQYDAMTGQLAPLLVLPENPAQALKVIDLYEQAGKFLLNGYAARNGERPFFTLV